MFVMVLLSFQSKFVFRTQWSNEQWSDKFDDNNCRWPSHCFSSFQLQIQHVAWLLNVADLMPTLVAQFRGSQFMTIVFVSVYVSVAFMFISYA